MGMDTHFAIRVGRRTQNEIDALFTELMGNLLGVSMKQSPLWFSGTHWQIVLLISDLMISPTFAVLQ